MLNLWDWTHAGNMNGHDVKTCYSNSIMTFICSINCLVSIWLIQIPAIEITYSAFYLYIHSPTPHIIIVCTQRAWSSPFVRDTDRKFFIS